MDETPYLTARAWCSWSAGLSLAEPQPLTLPIGYRQEPSASVSRMEQLFQSELFRHLELDALASIARSAKVRSYDRGAIVCREGDRSATVVASHDDMQLISVGEEIVMSVLHQSAQAAMSFAGLLSSRQQGMIARI